MIDDDELLSRRTFLGVAALAAVRLRTGGAEANADAAADPLVHVGTYTNTGSSRGIYRYRMDARSGALRPAGAAAVTADPSFLARHLARPLLFAVNELTELAGAATGAVTAFTVDPRTGALTALNRRASRGGAPCYVTVDRTGRFALVANYVGGSVAALPIGNDGRLGEATAVVQLTGRGPHRERQRSPHAHCIILDPANRYALVADLGTDRVTAFPFDANAGTLAERGAPGVALRPGAGPRHLAFHPGGRLVYVVNELDSTLTALEYDPANGALRAVQTLPTLSGRVPAGNAPADLHVAPGGRFLYLSNRGHNSIAVFGIHPTTGALSFVDQTPTRGDWPRNFAIDPSGRFLLVANQRSNSIVPFRVDAASGRLTLAGGPVRVPAPVCILFDPAVAG